MITLILILIIYTIALIYIIVGWIKFFNLKEKGNWIFFKNPLFFCPFVLCNGFIAGTIIKLIIKI